MEREVNVYKGKEIDNDKIALIKKIAATRYAAPIYDSRYWSLEDVRNLAFIHDIDVQDEILVLGNDWFLCYCIKDNIVEFLEWIAIDDDSNKLKQTGEMLHFLKNLLLENEDKRFFADMRHDTSYQFYLLMKEKGYINEVFHDVSIDYCGGFAPEELKYLDNIESYLESPASEMQSEYLKYICHYSEFLVTEKFTTFYKRLRKLQ